MTKAREFLEKLQKESFATLKETPEKINEQYQTGMNSVFDEIISKYGITDIMQIEQIKKELDVAKQTRANIELPTKYETIVNYSLILDFAELIEKAIPVLGFMDKEKGQNYTLKDLNMNFTRPLFGTLPAGGLNATSYGFSNSERLIIFESELLQFCNLISKIVAKSIPFVKENDQIVFQFEEQIIRDKIEEEDEIFERFKDLIIGFLLTGRATSASQYILEAPFNNISDHLRLSMEVFIMGHEYAHILLRHLDSAETSKQVLDSEDVFNISYSWQQEFDADGLGLPLMITALHEQGRQYLDLSYCGADLFFSSYEIIERAKCILKNSTDEFYWKEGKIDGKLGVHPPSEKRREHLRKIMEYQFGSESLKRSILIEKIINILWDKLKPELIKQKKELRIKQLSYQVEINSYQKKYSDVLDLLSQILDINSNYIPALFGKGNTLQELGRFSDANKCYDDILKLDRNNVGALLQKSKILLQKEDYDKALEICDKALKLEPLNIHVLYERGIALDYLKRFDESMQCFDKILAIEPKNIVTLFRKAFVFEMNGYPNEALIHYDKVLEIDPNHENALIQKMMIYAYLEKHDDAIIIIDKLIEQNPDDLELIEIKNEMIMERK